MTFNRNPQNSVSTAFLFLLAIHLLSHSRTAALVAHHGPSFQVLQNNVAASSPCLTVWRFELPNIVRSNDFFTEFLHINNETMKDFEGLFLLYTEKEKCPRCVSALASFKEFAQGSLCAEGGIGTNVTAGVIEVSTARFTSDLDDLFEKQFGKLSKEGLELMFPSIHHIVNGEVRRYYVSGRNSEAEYKALMTRNRWMIPTPISLYRLGDNNVNKTKIPVTVVSLLRIMANPPFEENDNDGFFWGTICLVTVIIVGMFYVMITGCFQCFGNGGNYSLQSASSVGEIQTIVTVDISQPREENEPKGLKLKQLKA